MGHRNVTHVRIVTHLRWVTEMGHRIVTHLRIVMGHRISGKS